MCVAVKADAYGHGAVPCARAALEAGADYLSVATYEEGVVLRNAGIASPILMLSLCSPDEVEEVVSAGITPFVIPGFMYFSISSYTKAVILHASFIFSISFWDLIVTMFYLLYYLFIASSIVFITCSVEFSAFGFSGVIVTKTPFSL